MRTKAFIIVACAGFLGVVVFFTARDSANQKIVDQLARQQAQVSPPASRETTSDRFQPKMFRLTSALTAEKLVPSNLWVIQEDKKRSTLIELPFAPNNDGTLPQQNEADKPNVEKHDADEREKVEQANDPHAPGFMGAAACRECHQERHDSFIHTAHHRTSGLVQGDEIKGPLTAPKNLLKTRDPNLFFSTEKRGDRYFQKVSLADWSLDVPLDVFTGSAKSGRTFLYWHDDALFQTHVSYLSDFDEWIPSPGYTDTDVTYARVIRTECLECHVTYIERKRKPNVYDRESAVWGISCERCHGPGRRHVEFHRDHPETKESQFIVHPADLSRNQQLDICGQCHSGSFSLLKDAFTYRAGEELEEYHKLHNPDFEGVGGIHTSNQLMRLKMSKCFQESTMTCTTCHDPHQNQRKNTAVFTKSCLSCHEPAHCGMSGELGDKVAANCIDCHMPQGDNEGMTLQVAGGSFTVSMIDHYIRVDKQATAKYMKE